MPFNPLPLRSAQSALAARPGTERPSEAETTFLPSPGQRSPRTKKEEEKKLWSFVDWWQYRFAPSAAGGAQRMTAANTIINTRSDALSPEQPAACWTPLGGRMGVRRVHLPLRLGESVGITPKLNLC